MSSPKEKKAAPAVSSSIPVLINDPRFCAGRKLVGESDGVEIFSTLLAQARETYGAAHVETIPGYYEYGNALLRCWQRGKDDEEVVKRRDAAAAAAEKRAQEDVKPAASKDGEGNAAAESAAKEKMDQPEDLTLALEMMETAWSILDEELTRIEEDETKEQQSESAAVSHPYHSWMLEQRPRILTGLGDLLIEMKRPADATDAFLRALQHRQDALDMVLESTSSSSNEHEALNVLPARRRLVEANILVTEALLGCPREESVTTTETQTVLVPAGQVVEYARGYYDKARDALQEVVVLLGQLAAAKHNVDSEKEDVCYLATIVMGAGETLAQMDEEENNEEEPSKKKAKVS